MHFKVDPSCLQREWQHHTLQSGCGPVTDVVISVMAVLLPQRVAAAAAYRDHLREPQDQEA